ncbi:hypothetical protein Trco_003902 [Trichoderma cornu-damae]|uniref:F-box domain-containing protein n=1 Tax=Trichoderma cornu-damae TaxID=654480 RepID=A0A9P8QLY6_9HYPO|nr:hypothetical protein Trco_003902 [Trichoderma cornu-damae]
MDRVGLTNMPGEVLHNIAAKVTPKDLASLLHVSRLFHNLVDQNQTLPKDVYQFNFEHQLNYVYVMVHRLVKHASSAGYSDQSSNQLASKNMIFLKGLFDGKMNQIAFMHKSSLFERIYNILDWEFSCVPLTNKQKQLSAKLHCLSGKPILKVGNSVSIKTYPYACSMVYDLRRHNPQNKWGPFRDDGSGRVDWEKVEAIFIVLGHNIYSKKLVRTFGDIWNNPFSGSWKGSFSSPSPNPDFKEVDAEDPYGVTGTWYRMVSSLDYDDFFSYNFTHPGRHQTPRPPLHIGEMTRFGIMRIHVTKVEEAKTGSGYSMNYPVVHYEGTCSPLDRSFDIGLPYEIQGFVGMTRYGDVHWTSVSLIQGQERWKNEGIQIGGLRSARGVLGNWFDVDHHPHGPCGPLAYWKVSDSESELQVHTDLPRSFFLWNMLIHTNDSEDSEYDVDGPTDDEDDSESGLPSLLVDTVMEIVEVTDFLEEEPSSNA